MKRRIFSQLLPCLVLILCAADIGYGQGSNTNQPALDSPKAETSSRSIEETRAQPNPDEPPEDSSLSGGRLSSFEFMITSMIVGVALIALFMEFILLRRVPNLKAEDALRVFAVTLILIGTLFFISAGFDSKQIAPAMGLFGTVAGYLLGKNIDRKESKGSE
jgi:hypothetical protein